MDFSQPINFSFEEFFKLVPFLQTDMKTVIAGFVFLLFVIMACEYLAHVFYFTAEDVKYQKKLKQSVRNREERQSMSTTTI